MHLDMQLPTGIENGARRTLQWDIEIVRTDGGQEVRNSRWSAPLRQWEIAFNNEALDGEDHATVLQMWIASEGGTHTFNWHDERADEMVKVRFDSDLTFTNTVGPYHHLDTFVIREVRE